MTVHHIDIMHAIEAKEAADAAWSAGFLWGICAGALMGALAIFLGLSL